MEVAPRTRYARNGDIHLAYQVAGEGPRDLVCILLVARFLRRLASFSRLIVFDKRGTGLSDRVPVDRLPSLEERMDEVRAVMDAAGSTQAALFGASEGGALELADRRDSPSTRHGPDPVEHLPAGRGRRRCWRSEWRCGCAVRGALGIGRADRRFRRFFASNGHGGRAEGRMGRSRVLLRGRTLGSVHRLATERAIRRTGGGFRGRKVRLFDHAAAGGAGRRGAGAWPETLRI